MKKRYLVLIFVLLISSALFAGMSVGNVAYAENADVSHIDRVMLDIIVTDEEGVQGERETDLTGKTVVFGQTILLKARADDGLSSTAIDFYDDVTMYYQWFFLPQNSTAEEATPMSEVIVGSSNVSLTLTEVKQDSGKYYVKVTSVLYAGETKTFATPLVSDTVSVTITPRPLYVQYSTDSPVYNGKQQDIGYTLENEIPSRPADCVIDYDVPPIHAGTYHINGIISNSTNYYFPYDNSCEYEIQKKSLIIRVGNTSVLSGYKYSLEIVYRGFVEGDDESVLSPTPVIPASAYGYKDPGSYEVYAYGPETDEDYELNYRAGFVTVNRSVLEEEYFVGEKGRAYGNFEYNTVLNIRETVSDRVANAFSSVKVPKKVYRVRFTEGQVNSETYTIILNDVNVPSFLLQVCFVNYDGVTKEQLNSYSYKDNTLTLELTQTNGYVVVYYNYLWVIIPGSIVLIIVIGILAFHYRDRRKHKLNRLIVGSAKVEADYYREKLIGYHQDEQRKVK